jgi:hypothetical protein
MSILYRSKQDAAAQDYFDHLYKHNGTIPINHQMAINLRMQFFTKYVLERRVRDYKSNVEKDWMYIAQREYWYDVNVRAAADGAAAGLTAMMLRMFMVKKMVWWPFAPVFALTYAYRSRYLFVFHNKKLFDMCNVGEQYEVGFARNVVLRQCNKLLDREDF